MKFVGIFQREIPGEFKPKDSELRQWNDFQFLDATDPPADGLEELIRFRADRKDADRVRVGLVPGQRYEIVINRMGWDRCPIIYRGRIGQSVGVS